MRLRAQKFLLFSFAFSSVLTFTEALESPTENKNGKTTSQSSVRKTPETEDAENKVRPMAIDHGLDKRSAEVYPENLNMEEDTKQDLYEVTNPEKRTRLGFTGMRGKKEFSADDYCAKNPRVRLEGALNKRVFRSYNELFGGKRASLAFHGMRGKKSEDYDNENSESFDFFPRQEFLMSSGLMDDPEESSEFQEEKRPEDESMDEEMLSKRSPYSFQGMKGKKEYAYDLKRAMGFLGMRGKKATEAWDSEGNFKRAPQTSFFGMKGKKAQSSGFFGMRGKKASTNAFFGIKGKREPLVYDLQDLSLLNEMKGSGSSRNRYRRGISWLNNSKKAKNAFFGIRGKKSTEENWTWDFGDSHKEQFCGRSFEKWFCGDLDCPDWLLAEINTLSKMSSIKVKMLCQIVAKSLTRSEFDEEKAKKLVLDAKLDLGDMKACVSALSLIIGSSARYAVEEDVLNNELQQLGLPKEHATGLCKVYSEHLTSLTEDLEKLSMRTSTLEDVNCSVRDLGTQEIELNLKMNDKIRDVISNDVIAMTSEQLALLLADLKSAREEMKSLPS